METLKEGLAPDLEQEPTAANAVNEKSDIDSLGPNQKRRYHKWYPTYLERTVFMVKAIPTYGRNCYTQVNGKIEKFKNASDDDNLYYDALIAAFELEKVYTKADIERIVKKVRENLGLESYGSQLWKRAKADIMLLFYVEEIKASYSHPTKGSLDTIIGYKLQFTFKPTKPSES